ncbi:T9SS type A sorting domain-containing protein [uncultured Dokdonia sp.]|uniref:T9SS type A sorting domain-containing protein n=1 Tax=uncultured Dokdonia sp. TaxID=575653 RepID=UPI00261BFF06|nr:T9SS type A sorting domain-containing protein [uncultured Dokdonia sp.]
MKKSLFYLLFIISHVSFSQVQIGQIIDGQLIASDFLGTSVTSSGNGQIIAIGGTGNNNTGQFLGYVNVFILENGNWSPLGDQIVPPEDALSFGSSISLTSDGNTMIIGAPEAEVNGQGQFAGKVFVYEYNGSEWIQKGTTINGGPGSALGFSVDINDNGDRIVIGIPISFAHGQSSGNIEIYNYDGNDWVLAEFLPTPDPLEEFGSSVSMSSNGNIIAVGSKAHMQSTGLVRAFIFSSNQWFQLEGDILGENSGNLSGSSVSISENGNRIAIGAPWNSNNGGTQSGHIRVYERQNSEWIQIGQDIDGESNSANIGTSIELSANGNVLSYTSRTGELFAYGFINNSWVQLGSTIESIIENNAFNSAAISGDGSTIIIGSPFALTVGGAARIFDISALLNLESFNQLDASITLENNIGMGHLLIYKDNQLLSDSDYRVFAISGQKVKEDTLTNGFIDIANLSTGTYFVKVNINNSIIIRKFIKD